MSPEEKLLRMAHWHLDGMRMGCECASVGYTCVDCLCRSIEELVDEPTRAEPAKAKRSKKRGKR